MQTELKEYLTKKGISFAENERIYAIYFEEGQSPVIVQVIDYDDFMDIFFVLVPLPTYDFDFAFGNTTADRSDLHFLSLADLPKTEADSENDFEYLFIKRKELDRDLVKLQKKIRFEEIFPIPLMSLN